MPGEIDDTMDAQELAGSWKNPSVMHPMGMKKEQLLITYRLPQ